jgi:hypothetical protein
MAQLPFKQQLELHSNEADVRDHIAHGRYNSQHLAIAQEWLRSREEARRANADARQESREEQALAAIIDSAASARAAADSAAISASASRRQANFAMWAAVISVVSVVVAAATYVHSLS